MPPVGIANALGQSPAGTDWSRGLEGELLSEADAAFHQCKPTIVQALESHLQPHMSEYIETS